MDPTKLVDKALETVDKNVLSAQERAEHLTRRLELDVQSDNPLAKMIRPLITLTVGSVWVILHLVFVFKPLSWEVLASVDATFMTCIGFYFDARKKEKIATRKAMAAVKISSKDAKIDRRIRRREARRNQS